MDLAWNLNKLECAYSLGFGRLPHLLIRLAIDLKDSTIGICMRWEFIDGNGVILACKLNVTKYIFESRTKWT